MNNIRKCEGEKICPFMNTGAANVKRILNVSSWGVRMIFAALTVMVIGLNASCPLAAIKVAGAIQHLLPLQVVHPVLAVIVALAIENLIERQMKRTIIFDGSTICASWTKTPFCRRSIVPNRLRIRRSSIG